MKVFFQIAYFAIGLVQLFAVWDGAAAFVGNFFGFFVGLFLTYIPLIGSALGVYGAVHVWQWTLLKAMLLFFWYVPVYFVFFAFSFVSAKR
jgi:hypothetical protein